MMHNPPYYNPAPTPQHPSTYQQPPLAPSALLASPPLLIPPALNRPRLKRAFSSSDPPLEPSQLGAIEESQWGEAHAERLDGGWGGRPGWAGMGEGVGGAAGVGGGVGGAGQASGLASGRRDALEDRHQSKRYKADIAPQFASLSLQPNEVTGLEAGKEGSLSPPQAAAGLGLAGLASQPGLNTLPHPPPSFQLQPPPSTSTFVTPPMPTSARFAPHSPTRITVAPSPSPPRALSLDSGADAAMNDSLLPTSPPRRPIASIPPPSPGAALRALPLAVERLRSPGMGIPNASTEGKSLRRTSSLRRSSSLAPDPEYMPSPAPSSSPNPSLEMDDIPMRPAQSSYDISPHRVYVASLDDSDDEAEPAGRPASPVILPPGAAAGVPLPPRPLPKHLLPPTSLPPGQGALTLYRPLTFGKAKAEAASKGEEWDDFMRARQVEEVEGMGRSDSMGDAGMEEEIMVGDAEGARTPGSEGMELD